MIGILIACFAILAILGVPIAVCLGVASIVVMLLHPAFPLITVAQRMITGIDSYVLISVPLFMLTGSLMNEGGITDRIFGFARALFGHIRGGLGHVNVVASMIFAGMSGSAVADAGGLGIVEIKAMDDQGFPREFSAAITCASSAIGPIIPPSIPMLIYAAIAGVSPGKLFLAGFVPGVLMGIALMIAIIVLSLFNDYPRDPRSTLWQIARSFADAFLCLLAPVIIMGGIMSGFFTPTEASAVAAVYAFVLGFLVYRTIHLKDLPRIIVDTAVTTAVVMIIVSASASFSWILLIERAANVLVAGILQLTTDKNLILLSLNIVMLILGCFMENGVLLILLTPLFLPIAVSLNVDLIQFGVIMVLNLMIGVVTPPVGMSLFVVSKVSGLSVGTIGKASIPFIIPLIAVLALVTYFPVISLWLPNLFMK